MSLSDIIAVAGRFGIMKRLEEFELDGDSMGVSTTAMMKRGRVVLLMPLSG